MTIDNVKLEAFITKVVQRFSTTESHAVLMRFMCRCLPPVRQFLPEVGCNALQVATTFWLEGKGPADILLTARVECWKYLDAKGSSTDIRDQEDAAMRALICVLYEEPESDDFSVEAVRWFATMLDQLGNYSDEVERLMEVEAG